MFSKVYLLNYQPKTIVPFIVHVKKRKIWVAGSKKWALN